MAQNLDQAEPCQNTSTPSYELAAGGCFGVDRFYNYPHANRSTGKRKLTRTCCVLLDGHITCELIETRLLLLFIDKM